MSKVKEYFMSKEEAFLDSNFPEGESVEVQDKLSDILNLFESSNLNLAVMPPVRPRIDLMIDDIDSVN